MQKETNVSHGLKWGVIIGLIYCVLLFLRYSLGAGNPIMLGLFTFVGYLIILVLLLICGLKRRKQLGGYIEFKDAFQTLFVTVIGYEFFYTAFNFIYLKFINPTFFQTMKDSMEDFMTRNNVEQSKIDEALQNLDTQAAKNLSLGSSLTSLAFAIAISGVFALIFALIIKRTRQPFDQESFSQSNN